MKIAVVTGTSYGLGKSISESLLEEGYKMYGISRTDPKNSNTNFKWIKAGLTDEKSFDLISKSISEDKIDVLINNAGTAFYAPALKFTNENFQKMFDLNFEVPVKLTERLNMKLKGGLVINISSNSDRFAEVNFALYCSSKAALNIYFDTIALENKDLKIINLLPTYIDTPLARKLVNNDSDLEFWDKNMQVNKVGESVAKIVKEEKDFPNGARIMIINNKLKDEVKDPEKLYSYNVDIKEFKKIK